MSVQLNDSFSPPSLFRPIPDVALLLEILTAIPLDLTTSVRGRPAQRLHVRALESAYVALSPSLALIGYVTFRQGMASLTLFLHW